MPETVRTRNHLALGLLVLAKCLGIGGLILGMSHRFAGGLFLALDGVFLVASIALCIKTSKLQEKADLDHKAALAQMVREGTLDQLLRDIRAEAAAADVARESPAMS